MRMKRLIAAIVLVVGTSGVAGEDFNMTVVHVNDIHSHLGGETLDIVLEGKTTRVDAGGYGRIVTKLREYRAGGRNVLALNAGDALQGTLYYTLFGGEADAAMMRAAGWDAFVPGNHEFDNGDAPLARFLTGADTPVIAANVTAEGGDPLHGLWKPCRIKRFGTQKVGIIGIDTARATETASRPGKAVHFYDEIARTQHYVDVLKAEGVDKIILLSHFGFDNDVNLSRHVSGVDVIVGGHSHTLMGAFDRLGLPSEQPYPVRTRSADGEPVCIVQAWAYAKIIGRLDIVFDAEGKVRSCSGTPVLMVGDSFARKEGKKETWTEVNASERQGILSAIEADPSIERVKPDVQTSAVLETYKKQVDVRKRDVIGRAAAELRHIRIPGESYMGNAGKTLPLGSEAAPVVAKAFYARIEEADMSIINAGGIRTDLPEGAISIDTVYTMLPFSNTLYVIEMEGREIRQLLEEAVGHCFDLSWSGGGAFPYGYGIRYGVERDAPQGTRVRGLEVRDRRTGRWSAIEDARCYRVVTISYLADGKDGYETFKRVRDSRDTGIDTYLEYAMTFAEYAKELAKERKDVSAVAPQEECIRFFKP